MSPVTHIEQPAAASSAIQSYLSGHGIRTREDSERCAKDIDMQLRARSFAETLGALLPIGPYKRSEPRYREGVVPELLGWGTHWVRRLRKRRHRHDDAQSEGKPPRGSQVDLYI